MKTWLTSWKHGWLPENTAVFLKTWLTSCRWDCLISHSCTHSANVKPFTLLEYLGLCGHFLGTPDPLITGTDRHNRDTCTSCTSLTDCWSGLKTSRNTQAQHLLSAHFPFGTPAQNKSCHIWFQVRQGVPCFSSAPDSFSTLGLTCSPHSSGQPEPYLPQKDHGSQWTKNPTASPRSSLN